LLAESDVPTVVSLDATPIQYDELGAHYAHARSAEPIERIKFRLNQRCFERAAHIVTWADWTKQGLVADYGISAEKISVIPPGVDVERWRRQPVDAPPHDRTCRILFVGGDLGRKGGHDLLAAFATLRARHGEQVQLHLVTPAKVEPADGVTVHSSMTPTTPE
jgi:glycosyltransferase involved in cell wall biosynthesis